MQKSSYHLVDPELRAFIDAMPADGGLTLEALPARRDAYIAVRYSRRWLYHGRA